jgi:hypothetical protein
LIQGTELNLKGLGHEINNCLMACKIKEVLSIYALMVTGNFYAFLLSIKDKVFALFFCMIFLFLTSCYFSQAFGPLKNAYEKPPLILKNHGEIRPVPGRFWRVSPASNEGWTLESIDQLQRRAFQEGVSHIKQRWNSQEL